MEVRYGEPAYPVTSHSPASTRGSRAVSTSAAGAPGVFETGFPWESVGDFLQARFPDLHRHFIFEYYAWYRANPYKHWNARDRQPPFDIAATSVPALGPYDSLSTEVLEQHAQWIAESGAGAINLSWWGRGRDRAVNRVMDVMADHDIKVAFHLESYADDRGSRFARDVRYLLRKYGERRNWDCFLLLRDANGLEGPVFKSFRTIILFEVTDCHGVVHPVPDYTPDELWRRQIERLRTELRHDFDTITLLADSLNMDRTRRSGFDGIAIYDNFVQPSTWPEHAQRATLNDLTFSFNCNPGFDRIERRNVPPDSCYTPLPFHPPTRPIDWTREKDRKRAHRLAQRQIRRTLEATLSVQTDDSLSNFQKGFFLVYLNSFNEWLEGDSFEPMKNYEDLQSEELAFGYHNASRGSYRLNTLKRKLKRILA